MDELLKLWGFDDLIKVFSDNKIETDQLIHLTPSLLAELIPPIGTRIKFTEKLKEYLNNSNEGASVTATPHDENHDTDASIASASTRTSTASNVDSASNFDFILPSPQPQPSTSTNINATNDSVWEIDLLPFVKSKSFYGSDELEALSKPVENLHLKKLLEKTYKGKYVLQIYDSKKILDRKSRTELVDIILTYVMQSLNRNINNEKFEILANKITELFPNENSETYYIKPIKKRDSKYGTPVIAKGKLIDKYRNIRTKLRQAGLLNRRSSSESRSESNSEESDHVDITDELNHSKSWLDSRLEPWDDVIIHWKKTVSLRRTSTVEKVTDFLNEWPHLKSPKGYVLINIDFDFLYPDKGLVSIIEWMTFFEKLLQYKRDQINADGLYLLNILLEATSNDIKFLVQLHLLPYLLPPRGRVKLGKKFVKPSILETQKSIIVNTSIPGDVLNIIEERRKLSTQSVQPYLLTEGINLQTINQVFVVIDDTKYKCDNIFEAFKICFESFHALNANYPAESDHIWLLLQISFFKIKTKWDKSIPYIMDVVQFLEQ